MRPCLFIAFYSIHCMLLYASIKALLATLILSVGAAFDVLNNREIPDIFLVASAFLTLLFAFAFSNVDAFVFGLIQSGLILAFGYLIYKRGLLGMADVILFAELALLFPEVPGSVVPLPLVLPVIIYSGVLFAVFALFYYLYKIWKRGLNHPIDYKNLLIFVAFVVFAYIYRDFPLYNPLFLYLLGLLSISATIIGMFMGNVKDAMKGLLPIEKAEEEVLTDEFAAKHKSIIGSEKVLTRKLIEKLKSKGIYKVEVYSGMLPYVPFLLLGFFLTYAYGVKILF